MPALHAELPLCCCPFACCVDAAALLPAAVAVAAAAGCRDSSNSLDEVQREAAEVVR